MTTKRDLHNDGGCWCDDDGIGERESAALHCIWVGFWVCAALASVIYLAQYTGLIQ